MVQIQFVQSESNLADPFSKNVSEDTYAKNWSEYLENMEEP